MRIPRKFIRRALAYLGGGVVAFYLICTFALFSIRSNAPTVTAVQAQRWVEAQVEGEDYDPQHRWTPLAQIPKLMQHSVIAAEDGAFYDHNGVDMEELGHVLSGWTTRGERLRGASTISQQLVKNLFLTTWRSPIRKLIEFPLVFLAEAILGKDRILELYLNEVEWGSGVWGVAAAAEHYYSLPLEALSRDQAARLAACLPAPRSRRPEQMNEYSHVILERMKGRGW